MKIKQFTKLSIENKNTNIQKNIIIIYIKKKILI